MKPLARVLKSSQVRTSVLAILIVFLLPIELEAKSLPAKIRALHVAPVMNTASEIKTIIDEAAKNHINVLVIQLREGLVLDHSPWKAAANAIEKKELVKLITYANQSGLEVIPEIKLLTHQEKLFQNNSLELMFNTATYDPRKEAVYDKVFPFLDEIISIFHPFAIHIGHDEVAGWVLRRPFLKDKRIGIADDEPTLPADLFVADVIKIHSYLKKKGVETWMWGDMLITPDEFPEMKPNHLHGGTEGYGKALRQKLPKDIVICDWHYGDDQNEYPSLAAFKAEGFRVLGATWKKEKTIRNFSRYAAEQGADGMIATTWFHVQRKEWDVVGRIIRTSGRIFNKDFPDAQ